jgi:zinc/manganese transport system ATP-binding protein
MVEMRLEDLSIGYGGRPALAGLHGVFGSGAATAVVGPNGAGKSTLLKGLAGVLKPTAGRIVLEGAQPRDVAYLPQDPAVDRSFPITVEDLVALGFSRRLGLFGAFGEAERNTLADAIAAVGLAGLEQRPIAELSGGQFQRALFARVIVQDAPVILLDEPFSAQDVRTAADLADLVRHWTAEGRVIVLVLHDLDVVRALCGRCLVLAREPIAWGPTEEALGPASLARAQSLAEGWPTEAAA